MPDLDFIMVRARDDSFQLFACRGAGKGCTRNRFRSTKAPCEDCLPADDPAETVMSFKARLSRGDA